MLFIKYYILIIYYLLCTILFTICYIIIYVILKFEQVKFYVANRNFHDKSWLHRLNKSSVYVKCHFQCRLHKLPII